MNQHNLETDVKHAIQIKLSSSSKLAVNGLQKYAVITKNASMDLVNNFCKNKNSKILDLATRKKIAN